MLNQYIKIMGHKTWCDFPSGPCDCGETSNEFGGSDAYHRKKHKQENDNHEAWCGWPSESCSCGLYDKDE